ncbi:hypothetical protein [Gracilibacillus alcaliphilus]|uniref:hypothetical protein n=1 Tax=Gracilibacillus alcaliphilus TaxID=1401441 RepID=UPI00195CE8E6|nr:hypothetical protein [Gracilibacillus alcaliphilus]MBM7679553.1 hypothetical protein [Gracilibacillus alcaliphilus]
MKIYVVVEEKRGFAGYEQTHMSFDDQKSALTHAINVASGNNGFDDEIVKLDSIYEVDLFRKEVAKMEIAFNNGLFDLKYKEMKSNE